MHQSAYPKIAHASLQGLNLIVKRYDIYIHENPLVHDYKKATNVKDANIDMSLTFNTTLGKKYAPHPTTLDSFIVNLKKYFKNEQNYVYNYTESNIDDNFRFTPNVIPKFD